MPVDAYFTSKWKKPRVNHAHDPAWARFKALPHQEQQAIVDGIFERRHNGERNTAEEISLLSRFFVTRRCRKAIARHGMLNKSYLVNTVRRVVGGYNTNPK